MAPNFVSTLNLTTIDYLLLLQIIKFPIENIQYPGVNLLLVTDPTKGKHLYK